MNNKKIKYGLNSAIVIIGAIIAVILLNSILISFDDRMSLEVDLTGNEIYVLSDKTEKVLDGIDKETKVVLLYDSQVESSAEYKEKAEKDMNIIRSVMEKYTEANPNVKFEVLDYYKNPSVILEDPVYSNIVTDIYSRGINPVFSMAFIQGDKYEFAEYTSYYEEVFNEESGEIENHSKLEHVITNKLRVLTSNDERFSKVLFTIGHGEKNTQEMRDILTGYSFNPGEINLISDTIPTDEKVLLIIDTPSSDFTDGEIAKLDDFLKFGGNAQVYFNPLASNEQLPKLESYLKDSWGIIRNHGVTSDTPNNIGESEGYMVAVGEYADHSIVSGLTDSRIMYTSANPLEIKSDKEAAINVETVLTTSSDAVLKTPETALEPVDSSDKKGKYNIILTSTKDHYDVYNEKTTGRVLVCGSSYAMDYLSSQSECLNKEMLINSFNWMCGNAEDLEIGTKELPEGDLVITNASKWGWFTVLVIVIPLVVLAAGVVVFVKRRYK